jgi:hypothetical protein
MLRRLMELNRLAKVQVHNDSKNQDSNEVRKWNHISSRVPLKLRNRNVFMQSRLATLTVEAQQMPCLAC